MKRRIFILLSSIIFVFSQCTTPQSHQIYKLMKKEHDIYCYSKDESCFVNCRKSVIDKLSLDIHANDTIILLERVYCAPGAEYFCTIYESKNNTIRKMSFNCYLEEEKFYEDTDTEDLILQMVLNKQFDEIKERGDASFYTPRSKLIINILTLKNKKKVRIMTLQTHGFYPLAN